MLSAAIFSIYYLRITVFIFFSFWGGKFSFTATRGVKKNAVNSVYLCFLRAHFRPVKCSETVFPPEGFIFIANSSSCTTTELCVLFTSCLAAIKNRFIKYCTTVYERNGKKLFWSINNSGEFLKKLKSRGFLASGLSSYDFSTLFTTFQII